MRRVLVLLVAVCVGCAKKDSPELPNVVLDQSEIKVMGVPPPPPPDSLAGKVGALEYGKLWDPADPAVLMKEAVAQQYFAKHQTEYLTAATIGTLVSATPGGPHGFVVPPVLTAAYPEVVKKMEESWRDRLPFVVSPGGAVLDFSTFVPGGDSTRVLVIRVKGGTDDLHARFDGYLMRLEAAVRGTGVTVSAHHRGEGGAPPLSDVRYQTPTREGYVRSLVVNRYDPMDQELTTVVLGDVPEGTRKAIVAPGMSEENGPYLVVALKEHRR